MCAWGWVGGLHATMCAAGTPPRWGIVVTGCCHAFLSSTPVACCGMRVPPTPLRPACFRLIVFLPLWHYALCLCMLPHPSFIWEILARSQTCFGAHDFQCRKPDDIHALLFRTHTHTHTHNFKPLLVVSPFTLMRHHTTLHRGDPGRRRVAQEDRGERLWGKGKPS